MAVRFSTFSHPRLGKKGIRNKEVIAEIKQEIERLKE